MQVVILAGGLGTRLRPITTAVPKPMVPVAGVPYLEHQLRLLARQSLNDVLILIGYLGEQIEARFGDGNRLGLRIRYCRERIPMGTGGALRDARWALAETFLVIYGDSYLPISYRELGAQLEPAGAGAVMAVYRDAAGETKVPPNIALGPDNAVLRYDKRARHDDPELRYIDAGVLALHRTVLDLIPREGTASLEEGIFPALIEQRRLFAHSTSQRFYDMGTPERLRAIEEYLG
jgi:NDP-sugar pyrophosphorylase family protein